METANALAAEYGPWLYALLFGYAALKSGFLPVAAGYLAALGSLDWRWAMLAAFAGGYLGDEVRFWIARRYGGWLRARPRLVAPMAVATMALNRYGVGYIFLYRYAKGLRTIGALPLGLSAWSWRRFSPLNFLSAALWAFLLVGGGYVAGEAVVTALGVHAGWFGIAVLIVVTIAAAIVWRATARRLAGSDRAQGGAA